MTKEMKIKGIDSKQLDDMIAHWERFKSCYFWSSPGKASSRRAEEERHARHIVFEVDGETVSYDVQVRCSCRNYYCDRDLYVNGVRKAQGLRYLRKLEKNGVFVD